jgi:Ca2+/Na+ antiporter
MLSQFLILIVAGGATVAAVRFLMMPGIRGLAAALNFSTKTTGQVIGYATSLPELTVLVAAALSGVFEAGFWNIASSNIINCILFLSAVAVYRQHKELRQHLFRDELGFALLSVCVPIGLAVTGVALSYPIAAALLGLFVVYRLLDARLNRGAGFQPAASLPELHAKIATATATAHAERDVEGGGMPLPKAIGLLVAALVVILAAGRFLGASAAELVVRLDVPSWALGWLLGVITSLPELTSFFEVYHLRRAAGIIDETVEDTQEALDALVSSNMCNLALILPIGTICYLLVTG